MTVTKRRRRRRGRTRTAVVLLISLLFFALALWAALSLARQGGLIPEKTYTGADFGIDTVRSPADYNGNGVDDYTDILLGAKEDAENHPDYVNKYYVGGYPPEDEGVCTDLVWRAFRKAGYCLRDMVDADIRLRPEAYPHVRDRDPNIDFRRVINLSVFFREYALSLTLDPGELDRWQPGDIVIFGDDQHIGIVSDRRAGDGVAYVLHNSGQRNREENILPGADITGHYRFDASLVPTSAPVPME